MQDFRAAYERQLDLLRAHAQSYDEGREHFALDIATKIRVFCHDTVDRRGRPRSVSLLTHLGIKDQLGFVDWAPPERPVGAIMFGFGLCTLHVSAGPAGSSVVYEPAWSNMPPDRNNPPTSFVDWWRLPVLELPLSFTRAEFVLFVADQEGAHVDAQLDDKYAALTRQNAMGIATGDGTPPDNDLALASVRHIAQELIETLDSHVVWDGASATVDRPTCPLPWASEEAQTAGRNDLCPCGSGRKRKQCFGLRRQRNATIVPGRTRLWVPPRTVAPDPAPHAPPPEAKPDA